MKNLFAMFALTLTLATVIASAAPQKDIPIPICYPCDPGTGS
jgi:hypothetical protein